MKRTYIAIDLKSFYASVECVERGLDPMTAHLVVADVSRTDKTICLAVSPALKAYGIPGRPRLFEVEQKVRHLNQQHPELQLNYIAAKPRMALYIRYSTKIYGIYLRYVAPEDIHVYSVDEVFMDVTNYLQSYKMTAHELTVKIIREVIKETGITATAGIGPNLYLAKVAMDIVAKHIPADNDGVRIAELDEMEYRKRLWNHKPLTSFWRVGHGIARRLLQLGVETMGQLARLSLTNEEILYKTFGVNAELLIDHAWGWEPCTIADIKDYRPESNSLGAGQVLHAPYEAHLARVVAREMADQLSLDLVRKGKYAEGISLFVCYDRTCLTNNETRTQYHGPVTSDHYGRKIPAPVHGTERFSTFSSSSREIAETAMMLYDRIVNPSLLVRRLNVTLFNVVDEAVAKKHDQQPLQLDLFTDYDAEEKRLETVEQSRQRERKVQETMIEIKQKFGKNAILKGSSYSEGATAKERNKQIGGHHE